MQPVPSTTQRKFQFNMWCAVFLGLVAFAFAEEAPSSTAEVSKRDSERGNVVIYGSSPGNYIIQNPDGSQQVQAPAYTSQPEVYISNYRKPQGSTLPYSQQARRPQYLTVQQLTALQQSGQLQEAKQPQPQPQPQEHGSFYKPRLLQQHGPQRASQHVTQQLQPEPQQYSSSGIVDSTAGSFEEELAQLVAANRAQEQKYNAASHASIHAVSPTQSLAQAQAPAPVPVRKPAPQQYLKEITRPTSRPAVARPLVRYQPQSQHYEPATAHQAVGAVATRPVAPAPLYRYVYQNEPQQLAQAKPFPASQQPEPVQRPQYVQQQQYIRQQPQIRPSQEDSLIRQLLANPQGQFIPKSLAPVLNQPEAPSRSQIYVSQTTSPYKKQGQQAHGSQQALVAGVGGESVGPLIQSSAYQEREIEETKPQGIPVVRIPSQKEKPLTQEEFQNLLQLGGYTATLLPSSQNSPHQEYLLQPKYVQQASLHSGPQRGEYVLEQDGQLYQAQAQAQAQPQPQPQPQPQQQVKRRPHYSSASA